MLTERAECVEPWFVISVPYAFEMSASDSNAKRERILDAALDQFTAYGFSRASMADVIEAAAARTRTGLTRYFSDLTACGVFDPERSGQPAARWGELIPFSPRGLKQDGPSIAQDRRRLDALAISVASGAWPPE